MTREKSPGGDDETIILAIRFKQSKLAVIKAAAEAQGIGVSTFIRLAALKAAKKAA